MVTSAAVPAVVGTAKIGTALFLVSATPSSTSSTFLVTPNLIRSGSEHTKAFVKERPFVSSAMLWIAPAP